MIVLIGKSGTGKTTIESLMVAMGYEKIISHTTRPKRPGEVDGKDYHFVSSFILDDMIEHTNYNGYDYGIHKDSFKKDGVVVVEINGLLQLLNKGLDIFIIEVKTSVIRRINRLISRDGLKGLKRVLYDEIKFRNIPKNAILHNDSTIDRLKSGILEALHGVQS